jgi:hypothetical protein
MGLLSILLVALAFAPSYLVSFIYGRTTLIYTITTTTTINCYIILYYKSLFFFVNIFTARSLYSTIANGMRASFFSSFFQLWREGRDEAFYLANGSRGANTTATGHEQPRQRYIYSLSLL